MAPDPAPLAASRLGQGLATVPAASGDDLYHLVHLLDRQQRAEGAPVSGVAASFAS